MGMYDQHDRGFGNRMGVYLIIVLVLVVIVTLLTLLGVIKPEPPVPPRKKSLSTGATIVCAEEIKRPL